MNRNSWTLIAAAMLTPIFAVPAFAADQGFYVIATLGQAREDPETIGTNVASGIPPTAIVHVDPDRVKVDRSGVAWSAAVGYRINRFVAAEVEYIDFGTTDISEHYVIDIPPLPLPDGINRDYSSKVTGPALSLLGSAPVGKNFKLFLRAGVLFADREVKFPNSIGFNGAKFGTTVWLGGAGVDWSFADRWAVRAEYQQTGKLDQSFVTGETELKRVSLSALFAL